LHIPLTLLLAAHLVLVDIAMAGPLVCIWLEWRETRRADPVAGRLGQSLARLSVWTLGGGSLLGGLLLAVRWGMDNRVYFSALAVIPSARYWFGATELIFSLACLALYVALWKRLQRRRLWHRLLAIAGASNLLVHFPALFAVVSVLSTRSEMLANPLDRAVYQRLLMDGEVLSRVTHVWLAAFAVSGAAVMVMAQRLVCSPEHAAGRQRIIRGGAWLALVPTMLQIPAGLWLAFQMPAAVREPILGGDWLPTGLFVVSLLLGLQLMHLLAAIALGDDEPKHVRRSVVVLLAVVVLMSGTRLSGQNHAFADRDRVRQRAPATVRIGRSPPGLASGATYVPIEANPSFVALQSPGQ
jgi:hypothetical protein